MRESVSQKRHASNTDSNTPKGGSRPRLLLLDDDEALLLPIARFLREQGYDVVTAHEPEEGEALLAHEKFDLVILDLALTRFGREGLRILRSIRAADPWLPVVVMSGYVPSDVEQEVRRLGADEVLTKPQPLPELARVVASILGSHRDGK